MAVGLGSRGNLGCVAALLVIWAATAAGDTSCTATITTYPGYTGSNSAVSGSVKVTEGATSSDISVYYDLKSLPTSSSGGLHVHVGTSCADAANVGGHYFSVASDPWTNLNYGTSSATGTSTGSFSVTTGYPIASNIGHAIVVHDSTDRIGCGVCVQDTGSQALGTGACLGIVFGFAGPILLGIVIYVLCLKFNKDDAKGKPQNNQDLSGWDLSDPTKSPTSQKLAPADSNAKEGFDPIDPSKVEPSIPTRASQDGQLTAESFTGRDTIESTPAEDVPAGDADEHQEEQV